MRELKAMGRGSVKSINHARHLMMVAAMAGITTTTASAASTWTGPAGTTSAPVSGLWNVPANWVPTGVPASSPSTELDFLGTSTYTSTDNIAGAFNLNLLKINGSGGTIAASGTSSLAFNGSSPLIQQIGAGTFTISAPVNFTTNTSVSQVNGGEIDFTGSLSGSGTLSLSNVSGSPTSSIVKFTGPNAFTGLTVNSHVTVIAGPTANTTTLGSGAVTLAGGTLKLQGQTLNGTTATQQIISLQNASFNTDIVYENTAGSSASTVDGGSALYEHGYLGGTLGLPTSANNRTFTSTASTPDGTYTGVQTGAATPQFQFQPYNGNNSMLVTGITPSTLALTTATKMSRVELLYTGSLPTANVNVTFAFSDGNTSTGTYAFTTRDWYGSSPATALDSGSVGGNGANIQGYSGNLTEVDFDLKGTDLTQSISSISFTPLANLGSAPKGLEIMAVSGDAYSTGAAASQNYANALNVTGNSSIDVSGSLAATMGNLTIGSSQLSITSSDASGAGYSMNLGTVNFNGNAIINIANSTGSGVGTLNLGALNDGGSARTITFNPTGTGVINLATPAGSLGTGTVINLQNGTLNSNNATALGNSATLNLSAPASFVLGASQQLSALNGAAGSIALSGNGLTIGSSDNLSSNFGGTISGTGSVFVNTTGTVTLSGSSTFTGSTVNSNGANILTGVAINNGANVVVAGPTNQTSPPGGPIVSSPLGTSAVLLNAGASLLIGNTAGLTVANPIYATSSGSALSTIGGLNTTGVTKFTGNITLGTGNSGDNSHSVILGASGGGEVDFTGNILNNSTINGSSVTVNNLSGSGAAIVKFLGGNTYSGGTTINPKVTLAIGPSLNTTSLGTGGVTLAGGTLALHGSLPVGMQQTIGISGFNASTITDNAPGATGSASSTGTSISTLGNGLVYFENGYQGNTTNGLPTSGTINSASTGHTFQLGSYTDVNTFRFDSPGTQTIGLNTPGSFQTLDFLAIGGASNPNFTVSLNFSDGSSDAAPIGGFTADNWYRGGKAFTGLDPAQHDINGAPSTQIFGTGNPNGDYQGNLTLGEYDIAVPTADQSKTISSITLNAIAINGDSAEVYAVSGSTAVGTAPMAAQNYANNFNVTADSAIDVSGSLNASIGTLTIGGQTLTITSADTTTSAFGLTTGAVNFVAQTPSFDVENSAGGGAGMLILGSINDGGSAQTLTKSGPGTLVLSAPATMISNPSTYNIAGGTLASNDANALSFDTGNGVNHVAIAVASTATFSIGADQAINSLSDYNASPVINGASVKLNGHTLTVGGVTDASSTFSGVISDGTGSAGSGGFVKAGGGVLTLAGASTYTGPTTITFGTLLVKNTTGSATGTGDVTLSNTSNATLASGTVGTISGNVIAGQLSNIQPGGNGSIGTLTIGGLTTGFNTAINFDLGSGSGIITNGDLLKIGGGTTSIATDTLLTFSSSPTAAADYRLIGGAGASSISLSSFDLPAAPSGTSYSLSNTVDPGFIDLVVGGGGSSGNQLLWNNSLSSTGDGVSWANSTGADSAQNWINNGAPSGFTSGDSVTFNDNNNGHYNVNLTSNVLPSSITVTSAGIYNIGSAAGFAIGDVPSGTTTLTQSGGGTLNITNVNTFTGATNVSGSGTTLHLAVSGALKTASLSVAGGSVANIDGLLTGTPTVADNGAITLGASSISNDPAGGFLLRTWSGLTIGSAATLTFKPATTTATRTLLVASSLSNSGKIDLANNDMLIHNGDIASIAGQIQSGFANGRQNAALGIVSSTAGAIANHLTAVGYAPGINGGTFDGQSTFATDVRVKYTYFGDANLDGKVDGSDYSKIDSGFLTHATGWSNGDFNYDGVINGSDYTLIDNAFNTQGAAFTSEIATAQIASATGSPAGSSVPEPTTLSLLALGTAGLLGRRRRAH